MYAPENLSSEAIYAQWQYLLYEKTKFPGTPFLDIQIAAYEKEMIRRGGNLLDFIEKELEKLI